MIILGQTLSDTEQDRAIREARNFANSYHLTDPTCSIRETAGPFVDLNGKYHNDTNYTWKNNHFLFCIKTGLLKVFSYSKVSTTSQKQEENPTAFLERLQKALPKHTNLDLSSYKGQVILKDRFLTQCASNIRCKLQKVIQKPGLTLDKMLTIATSVFYNCDQETEAKVQEKERRKKARHV